jgi:DNA polymerase III delta prime subunit
MVSFLISSKNKDNANREWQKICDKEHIDKYDITIIETEKTMGIGDIREAQKNLYLKPFKNPMKAVILDASLGITIDAQNALLKSFEEPPENTIMILIVSELEIALPTIDSRCKVINLNSSVNLTDEEREDYQKTLIKLFNATTGDKLKFAQDYGKTKEEGAKWTEKMILIIREKILEEEGDRGLILKYLKEFERANKILKTSNANPRLTLENLFFSI